MSQAYHGVLEKTLMVSLIKEYVHQGNTELKSTFSVVSESIQAP